MRTIRTWSMCSVLIAGSALLAVPIQPVLHAQGNQSTIAPPTQTSDTPYISAACTVTGRPCSPKASTCCPGLSCVFHGVSTRVGYMCTSKAAASPSRQLSENNLDPR